MKVRKVLLFALVALFIFSMSVPVLAKPRHNSPIFMGEILEVTKDNSGNIMLLVDGYLKGPQIYKEKLVAIVGPDTKVFNCNVENSNKVDFAKGDIVFIILSEAMTKSIPPQSVAQKIQVCKPVN